MSPAIDSTLSASAPSLTAKLFGLTMAWPRVTLGLVLFVLLTAILLGWQLRIAWRSRRVQARGRMAFAQESRAADVLEAAGFEIIDRQASVTWTVLVNGKPREFKLRADYLVTRDGHRYVADAKNGSLVANLRHGATRRQLLEYLLAYEADAALLVDMQREQVIEVRFPVLE